MESTKGGGFLNEFTKDDEGTYVESKIDIGVYKHFELEQEEYCFDVYMDDEEFENITNGIVDFLKNLHV